MSKLGFDDVVTVAIVSAATATPKVGYNIGLILGTSTHIALATRCKAYANLAAMSADGFLTTDPEYVAASAYFSQTPAPASVVVGIKDAGTGATETWVEALTDCYQKNRAWYGCYVAVSTALTTAEHSAIAAYLNGIGKAYFFDDHASDDIGSVTTDVFSVLQAAGIRRVFGMYSTTAYAGAAAMGYAMGANDGSAGSAYTMFGKRLAGVTPDDLSAANVETLTGKNANYYVKRGDTYEMLENGVTADGTWFDEVIGIDQLANDLQMACMDVITNATTKVPYTDSGVLRFVNACNAACQDAVDRGFLSPGVWDQPDVLDLATGDVLESGYLVMAQPVADQSAANRNNRICPPLYVAVHLTGAIHCVALKIYVN